MSNNNETRKSNIKVLIISLLIIGLLAGGIALFIHEFSHDDIPVTGVFNEMQIAKGNYEVLLKSQIAGHQIPNYDFNVVYLGDEISLPDNYKTQVQVEANILLVNNSVYEEYGDYDSLAPIVLFAKEVRYRRISDKEISIIYVYDDDFYLKIDLFDRSIVYDSNGMFLRDENGELVMANNYEEYDFLEYIISNDDFHDLIDITITKIN